MKISRISWLALAAVAALVALIIVLSLRQSERNGDKVADLQSQFSDAHDGSVQRQTQILDKLESVPTEIPAPTIVVSSAPVAAVPGPAGAAGPAGAPGTTTTTVRTVTVPQRPAAAPPAARGPSPSPSPTSNPSAPQAPCPARILGICIPPG